MDFAKRYYLTFSVGGFLFTVLAVEEIRAFVNSVIVGYRWCIAGDNVCLGKRYLEIFLILFVIAIVVDTLRNKGWFKERIDYLTLHNRSAIVLYAEEGEKLNLILKNEEWRTPFINVYEVSVSEGRKNLAYLFRAGDFHLRWRDFLELPFLDAKGQQFTLYDICGRDQPPRKLGRHNFNVCVNYGFKGDRGILAWWDVEVIFTQGENYEINIFRSM